MANHRQEYEHGYRQGYELATYNGNANPKRNILSRGISLRTSYAVGFLCGNKDKKQGLPCKYP
jgi:hypothetical protein